MAHIKVDLFNAAELAAAERQLRELAEKVQRLETELPQRLARLGLSIADARFAEAAYDGTKDVSCRIEEDGNRVILIAEGQTVGFIEFGTGVSHPGHPKDPYGHGTYGKGYGKRPFWAYRGEPGANGVPSTSRPGMVWTTGNDPARAMLSASEEMQERILDIVREVLGT